MEYTKIDIESWERKDLFRLYTGSLKIVMNMTVDMDITNLIRFVRERAMKFYPVMIWVVSKVINARPEFRYNWNDDGELILWDKVSPSYTDFNPDTEKFVKFVTEYTEDFTEFYRRVMTDREKYRNAVGFVPDQPKNTFDISCLPWTRYKSFDLHVFDEGRTLFPIVIWGKYEESDGKFILPVTANIHHAVADGFQVSRFFKELQDQINKL